MDKSFLERMADMPNRKANILAWLTLFLLTVVVIVCLDIVVARALDPAGGVFTSAHFISWAATALVFFALLVVSLLIYSHLLRRTLTRERYAEDSRRVSAERYRELFNEAMELVFIITREGSIIDINPAGVRMLGYDSIEALMQVDFLNGVVLSASDGRSFLAEVEKYGFVEGYELALRKRQGEEMLVAVNARAVRCSSGEVEAVRGVMRDITDQRFVEHQIMNGHRMVSIAQLSKGIAHQFNNVITTIQGYVAIAVNELPPDTSAAASLLQIAAAADRAERLTRELLMFSRHQPLNPRPLDINELVRSAHEMIGYMAGDDISLIPVLCEDPVKAEVDAASIESALLSLILFSRERMRGQGEIRVATGKSRVDSKDYLRDHPEAQAGDFVTLEVVDKGPIIGPGEVRRIFQPFTGSPADSESGLEMPLVYGIAINHDGWIDVQSNSVNTSFTIYLPAIAPEAPVVVEEAAPAAELRGNGERVLLVEDEDAVRTMAEMMLSSNGYVVFSAHDANEAFRIFVREKGEIDAVFADVIMPGESGVSLVGHLLEHKAGLPVILTSGHETNLDDWQSIQECGYHFLPKPYRMNELLAEMNGIFSGN
ncbi:MAG: hybrid sensor histidine kinase/response regulator [Thermoleophilia bacterium]